MWTRLSPPGGGQGPTSEFILRSPHACYGMDTPPLTNRCVHRGAPAQRIFKKVLATVIIWEWGTSRKADDKAWTSALQTITETSDTTVSPRGSWSSLTALGGRVLVLPVRMCAPQTLGWDQNWGALGLIPSTTKHTKKQTRQWFQHMRRKNVPFKLAKLTVLPSLALGPCLSPGTWHPHYLADEDDWTSLFYKAANSIPTAPFLFKGQPRPGHAAKLAECLPSVQSPSPLKVSSTCL